MAAATAQICPVVGTTTTFLPPNHPEYDASKPGLVCPVTNATTTHHHNLSAHPTTPSTAMASASIAQHGNDATACPALKNANTPATLTDATCPVVGPVSAFLPVDHPNTEEADDDAVCPVTKATKAHHKRKVHEHPKVSSGVCPVAHKSLNNAS